MTINWRRALAMGFLATLPLASTGWARAASPSAEDALKLAPVQPDRDVRYDRPDANQIADCTIKPETVSGQTGWVVRSPEGQILRRFVDTNGDNVVDQWSYFKDGLEVYRDIDTNHDKKADEFRWLNTGGSRWGLDQNGDGRIDVWKTISPEEVSFEIVAAIATRDAERFAHLLLLPAELKELGLSGEKEAELQAKLDAAPATFASLVKEQSQLGEKTEWIDFAAAAPGSVPAGTEGVTKDLMVYENVLAMIETAGKHGQLQIGTLIRVGDLWRVIEPPIVSDGAGEGLAGIFFKAPQAARPDLPAVGGANADELQECLAKLEKLDKAAAGAGPDELARINADRAQLLERMIGLCQTPAEQEPWVRQYADTVSMAVQNRTLPDGIESLKRLIGKLEEQGAAAEGDAKKLSSELAGTVTFRMISADYNLALQDASSASQAANAFAKINDKWMTELKSFVDKYPLCPDAAEALMQLGMNEEFAGQDDEAKKWYAQVVASFPETAAAKKAEGAKLRLDSVGKSIPVRGRGIDGKSVVDLAAKEYRGKLVLVHYWATWCEPCKTDMAELKELQAKYGGKNFALIGVNLDNEPTDAAGFVQKKQLSWAQIFEPGGLDSQAANDLGILTVPTMILVDQTGKVVNRNIHVTELEKELATRLRIEEQPAARSAKRPESPPAKGAAGTSSKRATPQQQQPSSRSGKQAEQPAARSAKRSK